MSSLVIDNVEEKVKYYKKKLEGFAAQKKKDGILYVMDKLKCLPVTVPHLERTGVGKSVNMLRNFKGSTGTRSRALVSKWKEMVSAEEEQESDSQEPDSEYQKPEVKPAECVNLEENVMSDDDNDHLQIEMPRDLNGNNLNIGDGPDNGYNPYTSQADYLSAGSSRQDKLVEEYVPTRRNTLEKCNQRQEISTHYSPTRMTDNIQMINGNGRYKNNSSEDGGSRRHKSKHKNKEKSKHKHKHHGKDKKKSKHSPSKSSHQKDTHSSSHTTNVSTKHSTNTEIDCKKNHSIHSNKKDSSKKSNEKKSSSKRPLEPMSDFGSALLGMDNYMPKPKRKRISNEKLKAKSSTESVTSIASSSSVIKENSRPPRLPSFNEGSNSSFQLSTSYKPMPQIATNKSYDNLTQINNEEEGLNYMYLAKKQMQKTLYTGRSSGRSGEVLSLFNQCIKVLQDNIDALEYTGGIPYMILKPVLEKATPIQLFNVENYNPYLLEDTGNLWELHCRRHFKNVTREEMETWRDLFIRSTDEKDQRLKNVTEKLERKFVTRAAPKRTTQLAEFVGGPNRSFKKMGKHQIVVATPKASVSSLSSSSQASSRPVSRLPAKKPKKGFMMTKAVQLYKKIYRR